MRFDGNTYTVPPWLIGKAITVKADHHQVTCYFKDKTVATHLRCWQRKQRIELPSTAKLRKNTTAATGTPRRSPPLSP